MLNQRRLIGLGMALLVAAGACKGSSDAGARGAGEKPATPAATTERAAPTSDSAAAAAAPDDPAAAPDDPIARALAHPARPAEDRARDGQRKPAEVLAFFGIQPGMKVAELLASSGYYTEILGRLVGPEGKVLAQNNQFIIDRFGLDKLRARLQHEDLKDVVELKNTEFDDLQLPGNLDAVLMILAYHDTVWMGADRAKMNKDIFDALAPGGVYGVIDHRAEANSGARDVKTLHRGDAEMIEREILAAGFELAARSDILRHPEDAHTGSIWDEGMRGNTDRFVFKFVKPAK